VAPSVSTLVSKGIAGGLPLGLGIVLVVVEGEGVCPREVCVEALATGIVMAANARRERANKDSRTRLNICTLQIVVAVGAAIILLRDIKIPLLSFLPALLGAEYSPVMKGSP
jgi:hypothetical protein